MRTPPTNVRAYLVDRAQILTSDGLVEGVVLVLRGDDNAEHSFCMAKEDAIIVASKLTEASLHARAIQNDRRGAR